MDNCIFCKIVKGEIPSHKIYEDENYLAFLDLFPAEQGHTIVVPKKHYDLVWDVDNAGAYFEVCKKIAKRFQEASDNKYVYSFIHGEGVPHAHIHIIPSALRDFGKKFSQALKSVNPSLGKLEDNEAEEILKKYRIDN